jgi:DMSO reductase iron-sulfur subunit
MTPYGWLLDYKRCIECRACESACKQWNGVDTGIDVRFRRVQRSETGKFPGVRTLALSLACNHCEDPWCVKVCPTKAMWQRDDGIVLVNQEKCIGCRLCEDFCPYQAPQYNARTRKIEKCTMCADRIDQGLQPACVTLCPTGALQWGKWEEVSTKGERETKGPTGGFVARATRPRIRFVNQEWHSEQQGGSR